MRIVCLSDTHLQHDFKVPDGDMLLHAGDQTFEGTIPELQKFWKWFNGFPHKYKIFIAGNHDWGYYNQWSIVSPMLERYEGITYLQDGEVIADGLKIYGSPWQPEFCNWAFNLGRYDGSLKEKWAMIPDDTNILITHGPPMHILDRTWAGEDVGCYDLSMRIQDLKNLKLHVFGHIHPAYGVVERFNCKFINASICNHQYRPVNAPIVVEVK